MHEEDGQAHVEQDDHADHDGVGTLEETSVRFAQIEADWKKSQAAQEWKTLLLTSSSCRSALVSLLGLEVTTFGLGSALGSAFWAGLATAALASTSLGAVLGSGLGAGLGSAGLGGGAGLGCLLGKVFVSALLEGRLPSLVSPLLWGESVSPSRALGAGSALSVVALGSGALGLTLGAGRSSFSSSSSSSGVMRLVLGAAAAAAVASGASVSDSNFCRALISRSDPASILLL